MRNPTLAEPELQTTDKGPPRLPAKQAKLTGEPVASGSPDRLVTAVPIPI